MLLKLNKKRNAFTLVEIMFVVAIIALLAAIAIPNFIRARKRAQAAKVMEDLRVIDAAIDQYGIDTSKLEGASVNFDDLTKYFKNNSTLALSKGKDMFGNDYGGGAFKVDTIPTVHATTFNKLSDVAPPEFWSPYH